VRRTSRFAAGVGKHFFAAIRPRILARTGVRNYSPVIPGQPVTVTPPS
jgi:hypothetical protein